MSIITISRGSYSRGKEVAEKLAAKLGYACVSREILLEASDQFNIPEVKLTGAIHDAPSFLDRLRGGKEKYVNTIRAALLNHVKKDNIVYHGVAGHFFLENIPHVLKVGITADMDYRIQSVVHQEKVSPTKAISMLKKIDEERKRWGRRLYGIETSDSILYDLVLNIGTMSVEDAIKIIVTTVSRPSFQTSSESQENLNQSALQANIQVCLADYPVAKLSIDAGHVIVALKAPLNQKARLTREVRKATERLKDIKELTVNMDAD